MANAGEVNGTIQEIEIIIQMILGALKAVPGAGQAVQLTEEVIALIAEMASKALTAWSQASGTPITVETVTALLPNPEPLTPPNK